MASQMQKEQNRISLKRQSNIQKSLSNPVSPTESNMDRRKSSVVSHKRSSRTSTISRGRSSIIGGKRVSVMDPTMDLDLENNPRLMETRPSKTEPQKPTRRSSRSSKLSKDSVASVMQPYQYTPDSSDQTLVRVARYRFGFLYKILSNFLKLIWERKKSFRIFFFELCTHWMYLLQALRNRLRQTEIRPGTRFCHQIKIFVPMGLYMDQNLNLAKKAYSRSNFEKRFGAMDY